MKKKVPYPCDFSFGCVDIDKKENKTIRIEKLVNSTLGYFTKDYIKIQ